jgi:hypothetical protein
MVVVVAAVGTVCWIAGRALLDPASSRWAAVATVAALGLVAAAGTIGGYRVAGVRRALTARQPA